MPLRTLSLGKISGYNIMVIKCVGIAIVNLYISIRIRISHNVLYEVGRRIAVLLVLSGIC